MNDIPQNARKFSKIRPQPAYTKPKRPAPLIRPIVLTSPPDIKAYIQTRTIFDAKLRKGRELPEDKDDNPPHLYAWTYDLQARWLKGNPERDESIANRRIYIVRTKPISQRGLLRQSDSFSLSSGSPRPAIPLPRHPPLTRAPTHPYTHGYTPILFLFDPERGIQGEWYANASLLPPDQSPRGQALRKPSFLSPDSLTELFMYLVPTGPGLKPTPYRQKLYDPYPVRNWRQDWGLEDYLIKRLGKKIRYHWMRRNY